MEIINNTLLFILGMVLAYCIIPLFKVLTRNILDTHLSIININLYNIHTWGREPSKKQYNSYVQSRKEMIRVIEWNDKIYKKIRSK